MSFDHPDVIEFFSSRRNTPEELYPSERRFLEPLARVSSSVIDVGCAAGGFASIWRAFNPSLRYAGVDASAPLIARARELNPDCEFRTGDAAALPFADSSADVVASLGVFHWEPRWREALRELWRVTARDVFFDLRLHEERGERRGVQRTAYLETWDGHSTTPYLVVSWPEVAELLVGLGPSRILVSGYWGAPADTVSGVGERVYFATFVVRRGDRVPPSLWIDGPLSWPSSLAAGADDRSSSRLEELL